MAHEPVRYRSADEDSARWLDFRFRNDDIVISARSKCGTTWMQQILALLVFRNPEVSRPLTELSPWLDWLILPKDDLFADLESQTHRRFIKTHTPLDGLPDNSGASFIVVARHPLDAATSLYHHSHNIDRERVAQLIGNSDLSKPRSLPPIDQWLGAWVRADTEAQVSLDSFNGVFHHLTDAWNRKDETNVLLVHYADLLDDLAAEMRRIAHFLEIDISAAEVDELAPAASFGAMRESGESLAPDPAGVLKNKIQFFRTGRSGNGSRVLDGESLDAYFTRAARTAPTELLAWLHR